MLTKNKVFVDHLTQLLLKIEENEMDKENKKDLNIEKLSYKLKSHRKFKENKKTLVLKKPAKILKSNYLNNLQNFVEENSFIYNEIGRGLSEIESNAINQSLKYHSEKEKKNFRYFGKIFGTERDYNIIYSSQKSTKKENFGNKEKKIEEEKELKPHWEKENVGVNSFIIYVSTNYENWQKLPNIGPEHIRASRRQKILFSGNLSKNLEKRGFPGSEEFYLKCQIIRILCSNFVIPQGYYKLDEETNKVIIDKETLEELSLNFEDLNSLENWVHKYPSILKSGRFSHFVPSFYNEEQKDDLLQGLEDNEPLIDLLRALNEDTEKLWKTRYFGKKDLFTKIVKENEIQNSFGVYTLESNNWVGALNVFSLNLQIFSFCYFGYGLKKNQEVLSGNILKFSDEVKQRRERKEPNHYEVPKDEEEEVEGEEGQEGEEGEEGADGEEGEEKGDKGEEGEEGVEENQQVEGDNDEGNQEEGGEEGNNAEN